ncbi:hypothetical protein HDU78_009828 [Chytriomyces hyalinus]|nr:hypothetical protein HDU78_009828 [Chytriomyces hyalinus]
MPRTPGYHLCPYCPKSLSRQEHLTRHIRYHHDNIRDHICSCCTTAFGRRDELIRHLRSHVRRGELSPSQVPPTVSLKKKLESNNNTVGALVKETTHVVALPPLLNHIRRYVENARMHLRSSSVDSNGSVYSAPNVVGSSPVSVPGEECSSWKLHRVQRIELPQSRAQEQWLDVAINQQQ